MGDGKKDIPLCVDLDGTLVHTDTFLESLIILFKKNPLYAFLFITWVARGKAHLKREVAKRTTLNIAVLPYHDELLALLRKEHAEGRRLVLATASDALTAGRVAEHLGIFSDVIASNGDVNFSGKKKLQMLKQKFGTKQFEYAGNSRRDLPIWREARTALLVNASSALTRRARNMTHIHSIFDRKHHPLVALWTALRPHQWLKNTLLFVPAIMAHQITNPTVFLKGMGAFVAFCLCTSAGYLINDLLDIEADRRHPVKRHRPVAAGHISLLMVCSLIPLLLAGGFSIALYLPREFFPLLGLYILGTTAYSLYLKQIILLDVTVLAALYTLRIVAGTAATEVAYSAWLLGFSLFLFMSLALLKRYTELVLLEKYKLTVSHGRGYTSADRYLLSHLGTASGYLSVLVLALYINSEKVVTLYTRPWMLWLITPLLIYWIGRAWLLASRGDVHDDPLIFAIRDPGSILVGLGAALLMVLAS